MSRFKIEDFPEHVQAQIRAQLSDYGKPLSSTPHQVPDLKPADPVKHRREPNKTEIDYQRYHLRGLDARYESLTFHLANGHRYTPDWVVYSDGRPTECHECKGSYALHSQQRAKLAFDQAKLEFPGLTWVWATKTKEGWKTHA